MRVSGIRVIKSGEFAELHALVHHDTHWVWGDAPFDLWYRYPASFSDHLSELNGDPFLAALLVPAMLLGEDLRIEAAVSPKLLRAARTVIQDIFHCWDSTMRRVEVLAPVRVVAESPALPALRGLFFSMGVDSSYSLLKDVREHAGDGDGITHLITVEGFDVYLWESERFVPMLASIRDVATELGKDVLRITTNLRDLTDRVADWPRLFHGAALASAVLPLGAAFSRVHVAATHSYDQLKPWGSHPLVDPLWGTEALVFVHDGCEARRIAKIRCIAVANVPIVLHNLRVCTTAELTDAYNCGRCEKCVRTMIGLHVCGALDRCGSLPHSIDAEQIRSLSIRPGLHHYYRDLMQMLGSSAPDLAIKGALDEVLSRSAV